MSTDLQHSDDFLPSFGTDSQEADEAFFDSVIGQSIENFRIEKQLGAGAMAAIYRAIDTTTNTPVALKLLHAAADDVVRARFQMEARTVRTLRHPNIVQVLDAGQTEKAIPYIAMTLVDGEDLGTFLEKHRQLTVLDSCRILQPIAHALAYAHDAGVIHRDVKPGNILLSRVPIGTPDSIELMGSNEALIPLLSDFGIARALDAPELTTLGRTIGTPAYMSPEQCAGNRQLDGRADIYSMGTVLYRCLIGRAPFVGATTQILHAHVYEAILIPDDLSKALPPSMMTILQKTLQKEPNARYASAKELADDLGRMIQEIAPANATLTMPSLPATTAPANPLTQVLVPGLVENPTAPSPPSSAATVPPHGNATVAKRSPTTQNARTVREPGRARRSTTRRPTNWAALLLGIFLSAGIGLILVAALITVAPRLGFWAQRFGLPQTSSENAVAVDPLSTRSIANGPPTLANPITAAPLNAGAVITATASTTAISTEESPVSVAPSPNLPIATTSDDVATDAATAIPLSTASLTATQLLEQIPLTPNPATMLLGDRLDVGATWRDVQFHYNNGDWGQARWNIMSMLSAKDGIPNLALNNISPALQAQQIYDGLIANPNAPYWRQWLDTFTVDEVSRTLADIYMGLANEDIERAEDPTLLSDQTADYLIAAATVRPTTDPVRQLVAAINRYLLASREQKPDYFDDLIDSYVDYAQQRDTIDAHCVAAQALSAAQQFAADRIPADLLVQYDNECRNVVVVQTDLPQASTLSGTIYYSTEADGLHSIWRVPLSDPASVSLVINNASQPSLYANQLAFYSRRSDSEGLSGVELDRSIDPNERFDRYTNAVEDARESPARWNSTGSTLVFSSVDGGDGKPRLYMVPAIFYSTKTAVELGEDPVWSPDGASILYRDIGIDGNSPGLFIRTVSNGSTRRLTNGDDRRPIWTPDGKYIIFMRDLGANNSELFRMTVANRSVVQLTANSAQDGLPAVNPAGDTIVFASDRNGEWNLWTISLFASETATSETPSPDLTKGTAEFLMPVQGAFLNWLEHSIQWVN